MTVSENSKKPDFLTRLFLKHGVVLAYRLPGLLSLLSMAVYVLLAARGVSKEIQIVAGLFLLTQIVTLTLGITLALQLRIRRSEHARLTEYVQSLREYAVNGLEAADKNFAELGEVVFPPPVEVPQSSPEDLDAKPLKTRERNTLLALIGVLCKEAGIDWTRPAAAAATLKVAAEQMDVRIGESTIEDHLKRVPNALEARSY